jgi:dTDP-4-dehydrorhamnose 3,5-epimerase
MVFSETHLQGAYVVRPERREDDRGHFARVWCREEFAAHKLKAEMVQLNAGFSHRRGTVRGMHFQVTPHAEAKFIRCTRGAIFDIIIDLRETSPTFKKWYGLELTPANGLMLYAPEGFAHGYQTLEDDTEMCYMTSFNYVANSASGVRWDDPAFGIRWPLPVSMISKQDQTWPDFDSTGSKNPRPEENGPSNGGNTG